MATRPGERADVARTDTRFAYRRPGVLWLLSLIVVPLALVLLLVVLRADWVEDTLTANAEQALAEHGTVGVEVRFDGRDAFVMPEADVRLTEASLQEAQQVVAGVAGVRDASVASESSGGRTILGAQLWLLLAAAYVAGSLLVWTIAAARVPSERRLEAETGLETEAVL